MSMASSNELSVPATPKSWGQRSPPGKPETGNEAGKMGNDPGGPGESNSDASKPSLRGVSPGMAGTGTGAGKSSRKVSNSQWSLIKNKLHIRGGVLVSGARSSLMTSNQPLMVRSTSKKSMTTTTTSNNAPSSVRIENTYQLEPHRQHTFRPLRVQEEIEGMLEGLLAGERYDPSRSGLLTVRIAEMVKDRVKTMGFVRHKLVVQTMLTSADGQSFEMASRCLWNEQTDNYTTAVYQSPTFFAVVNVYGLYFE